MALGGCDWPSAAEPFQRLEGDRRDGYAVAVRAPNALLRRNAVTAAARFPSEETATVLIETAAKTNDPVVLARAAAALAGYRGYASGEPLLERLQAARDPTEVALLAGCLGRLREPAAIPALLESRDRREAGPTAPAAGLLLLAVRYDPPIPWVAGRVCDAGPLRA